MSNVSLILTGLISYLVVGGITYLLMCRVLRVKKPGRRFIRNCLLAWPVVAIYACGAVIFIVFQSCFARVVKTLSDEQQ